MKKVLFFIVAILIVITSTLSCKQYPQFTSLFSPNLMQIIGNGYKEKMYPNKDPLNHSLMGPILIDYEEQINFKMEEILRFKPLEFIKQPDILTHFLFKAELTTGFLRALKTTSYTTNIIAGTFLDMHIRIFCDFLIHDIHSFKDFILYIIQFQSHIPQKSLRYPAELPLYTLKFCYHYNNNNLEYLLINEIQALEKTIAQADSNVHATTLLQLEKEQLTILQTYLKTPLSAVQTATVCLQKLYKDTEKQVSLVRQILPYALIGGAVTGGLVYTNYGNHIKEAVESLANNLLTKIDTIEENFTLNNIIELAQSIISKISASKPAQIITEISKTPLPIIAPGMITTNPFKKNFQNIKEAVLDLKERALGSANKKE